MSDDKGVDQERISRARIPALEEEIARLRAQVETSHRTQAEIRTELEVTQRIVKSILAGLAGGTR